jgi:hypothetical protein
VTGAINEGLYFISGRIARSIDNGVTKLGKLRAQRTCHLTRADYGNGFSRDQSRQSQA